MPLPAVVRRHRRRCPAAPSTTPAGEFESGGAALFAAAAPALPPASLWPVPFAYQDQTNWCWAAVGLALARFHNTALAGYTQCRLASWVFDRAACCSAGGCNWQLEFDLAMRVVGLTHTPPDVVAGWLPFNVLAAHLAPAGGRPVVAQINWPGGGHVVVVSGYQLAGGVPWVCVLDPADGEPGTGPPPGPQSSRWIRYEQLFAYLPPPRTGGTGVGTWTYTYLPRKA